MLDFQWLKSHFSFLFLYSLNSVSFWKNHSSNFRYIYSDYCYRNDRSRWANNKRLSLKYYGTSKRQKRERNIEGDARNEKFTEIRIRGWRISVNTHRNVLPSSLSRSTLATITFHVIDYRSIRDYDAYFPSYVSRKFMAARSNAPPWTSTVRVARMTPPIRVNPLVCYPVTAVQSSATTLPKLYETV